MKAVRLKEICHINMGQSPSSDSYNNKGRGLPFFQGNADFGAVNPIPRTWCDSPKKTASSGEILISVRAPIGAINIANERCCIGRGLAGIAVDESKALSNYVVHALRAARQSLEKLGTGSTFKAINKSVLSEFEIPIYELQQQQLICTQFDSVEAEITRHNSELALLDTLVKSRFSWMGVAA